MKYYIKYKILVLFFLSLIFNSCTEQYAFKNGDFESALVVEGTITNELKNQTIKISKVYQLEETGPKFETGAKVYILDDQGTEYQFEEKDTVYASITPFKAEPGRKYQLKIRTKEAKNYSSDQQTLTTETKIDNVTATVETVNGQRGVQINVNSYDPTNTSKYYRYEYTETYKIIAPMWDSRKATTEGTSIIISPRTKETRTCYSSKKSEEIILNSTNNLSEDRVHFPVRFISDQNYIISHRYTIFVKQYIQTLASYSFYKTMRDISSTSGNILSPKQPGFFYGNIKSDENSDEKVIGFFEVSAVSSERIYFNYDDLFPKEPLPPYYESNCLMQKFKNCDDATNPECNGAILRSRINTFTLAYFSSSEAENLYFMVNTPCGDCTSFSSNIIPPFWVD